MLMYLLPKTCCRRKSRNPAVPLTISNNSINNVVEALPRSSMRLPQQHVYDGHDTPDNAEEWPMVVVGSQEKGEEGRGKGSPSPRIDDGILESLLCPTFR